MKAGVIERPTVDGYTRLLAFHGAPSNSTLSETPMS